MSEVPPVLFARQLPFYDFLYKERQDGIRLIVDGHYQNTQHLHQMMVLAGAIIGLVVPLLSNAANLVEPWFLRRSVYWFGGCLSIGVVAIFIGRWWTAKVVGALMAFSNNRFAAVGAADTEEEIAEVVGNPDREPKEKVERLGRVGLRLALVGDVLFYGTFLRGVICILQGIR